MADGKPNVNSMSLNQLRAAITQAGWVVGAFALFPFDADELPESWYHRNGDRWPVASPQGLALASLSTAYKTNWGITIVDNTINVPTAYHSDGRPYFDRAVDGVDRLPGSVEGDAIRNVSGINRSMSARLKTDTIQAPFYQATITHPDTALNGGVSASWELIQVGINLSLSVPTAAENRVLNRGQTPAIYLGVPAS
jgi:hypothetical protein